MSDDTKLHQFRSPIALVAILIAIGLTALTYLAFETQEDEWAERVIAEQAALLSKDNEILATEVRETVSALQLLYERTETSGAPPKEALRAAIFTNPAAFQARWLSPEGMELIRFDRRRDRIVEIPPDQLQDKSTRDYYSAMKRLSIGQIYISAFDLNIENNQIEVPFKPTVRIGIRAADGFILANLNLSHLFSSVRASSYSEHETWLVTKEGDWLIAPDSSLEWGFLLGEPKRIQDTFVSANLDSLLAGERWSATDNASGDILIGFPLNLGSIDVGDLRVEANRPIILRLVPEGFIESYVAQHRIIQPATVYLFGALAALLFYSLLSSWRQHLLSSASALVKHEELERLQGVANLLPQMTWTTTPEGKCDFVNLRWESYTGRNSADLVGEGWFQYVHPDDQAEVSREWQHCVQTGEDFSIYYRLRDETGNYRMFDTRAHALKDNTGQVIKWFGSNTDVQSSIDLSQRVADEKSILEERLSSLLKEKRELLRRFEFATESANLGIWELDVTQGELVWDSKMFEIYGLHRSPGQNIYQLWRDSMHPDDKKGVESQIANTGVDGNSSHFQSIHLEYRIRRSEGDYVWVRDDAAVQRTDNKVRLIGCTQDITASKNLTLSLQEALAHLEQARKVASIGLFRIDRSTGKSEWSSEVFDLLGLELQRRFTLDRLLRYVVPEQRAEIDQGYRSAVEQGTPYDAYLKITTQRGEERYLHLFIDSIAENSEADSTVYGVLLDVSEQKRVELDLLEARTQAESSNAAKSAFLANISHEIRTPMNGILGMLTMLQRRVTDEENSNLVSNAYQAADRLMAILNDVLDISRAEAGKLQLHSSAIEIDKLLQESVDIFASNAEQKGVELEVEVTHTVPYAIKVDSLRLSQIISNLVGNAIKFTETGGRVQVALRLDIASSENRLQIRVSDSGIGMSPEELGRVFEEFSQADNSISKRYGGTGLGLAICKRLTDLMHGKITLESKEGQGTVALVSIPFDFVDQPTRTFLKQPVLNIDLISRASSHLTNLRAAFSAAGANLALFETLEEAGKQKRGSQDKSHLIIDSSLIDGPEGAIFNSSYEAQRDNFKTYHSQTILLPVRVSSALRGRLSQSGAKLIHGDIPPIQMVGLITNSAPATAEVSNLTAKLAELTIISVDDVELNNKVIEGILGQQGCSVETYLDAATAIERIKQGGVDLVLMDVHMPVMDGMEATAAIRTLPKSLQPIIVGLSASVLPEDRARGLDAGMDFYLNKPFQIKELLRIMNVETECAVEDSQATVEDSAKAAAWPEFIDTQTALKYTNGDQKALLNLMRAFVNGFNDYPADYASAVERQDKEALASLTHRLKGAASYIGDSKLQKLASTLEQEIIAGSLPNTSELGDLVAEHTNTLAPLITPPDESGWAATPSENLLKTATELLAAYTDNCFIPASEWRPVISGIISAGLKYEAEQLQQSIEANNFKEAAAKLGTICETLERQNLS